MYNTLCMSSSIRVARIIIFLIMMVIYLARCLVGLGSTYILPGLSTYYVLCSVSFGVCDKDKMTRLPLIIFSLGVLHTCLDSYLVTSWPP
ncbi:hypothetical protein GGR58DRAFT_471716 [Xylaria digitata]|nr:hypothetical protein GGR58DRAFT_471716 [Xylaria digitata]